MTNEQLDILIKTARIMVERPDTSEYSNNLREVGSIALNSLLQLSGNNEQASYPEKLPCSVTLNPRLTIGKGCLTSTLLLALRRRAEREAELEAMTPDERKAHSDAIDAFRREFIPQANYPVIPEGWARMMKRWHAFGIAMQNAGSQLPHNLISETDSLLAAAPQPGESS